MGLFSSPKGSGRGRTARNNFLSSFLMEIVVRHGREKQNFRTRTLKCQRTHHPVIQARHPSLHPSQCGRSQPTRADKPRQRSRFNLGTSGREAPFLGPLRYRRLTVQHAPSRGRSAASSAARVSGRGAPRDRTRPPDHHGGRIPPHFPNRPKAGGRSAASSPARAEMLPLKLLQPNARLLVITTKLMG